MRRGIRPFQQLEIADVSNWVRVLKITYPTYESPVYRPCSQGQKPPPSNLCYLRNEGSSERKKRSLTRGNDDGLPNSDIPQD